MRIKGGTTRRKRVKKILKQAKGFRGARSRHYKKAKEAVMHSMQYWYISRKKKKRDFRRLWITRINAATRQYNLSYNKFINGLKKANIPINRKVLAELAVSSPKVFEELINESKNT